MPWLKMPDDAPHVVVAVGDTADALATLFRAADERAASTVEAMCDWTADFRGARTVVEPNHAAWHHGNPCPYDAMAAVLRGQPDPRHPPTACRVCACTDDDCSGCIQRTGRPCSWVEHDLCSACAGAAS